MSFRVRCSPVIWVQPESDCAPLGKAATLGRYRSDGSNCAGGDITISQRVVAEERNLGGRPMFEFGHSVLCVRFLARLLAAYSRL